MTKIIDTFEKDGEDHEVTTIQPRTFCYVSKLIHLGLSQRQVNTFFQLCRLGGISFDLQNKHGTTFILIGSLRVSIGLISTAKDRKIGVRLMLKSLDFIIKQSYQNFTGDNRNIREDSINNQRSILSIKDRLENLV